MQRILTSLPQIPSRRAPFPHTLHPHAPRTLLPPPRLRSQPRRLLHHIQCHRRQRKHIRPRGRNTGKQASHFLHPRDSCDCRVLDGSGFARRKATSKTCARQLVRQRRKCANALFLVVTAPSVSLHHRPRHHALFRHHRARKPDPALRLPVTQSGYSELCR